jgi:hypothetical protein
MGRAERIFAFGEESSEEHTRSGTQRTSDKAGRQKGFGPKDDGEFRPNSSLLTPHVALRLCSSFAPRFGLNSTCHATHADFLDSLQQEKKGKAILV